MQRKFLTNRDIILKIKNMKNTKLIIDVELDDQNAPQNIKWTGDGASEPKEAKAMLLSLWDAKALDTLRIDLWTKDMPLSHMKGFYHQVLVSLAKTYERATGDVEAAESILDFAEEFTKKNIEKNKK